MFFQKLSEFSEKYTVFLKNLSEFSGAKYGKNREKFCFCGREVGKCKRPQRTALTAQKGSPCGLPLCAVNAVRCGRLRCFPGDSTDFFPGNGLPCVAVADFAAVAFVQIQHRIGRLKTSGSRKRTGNGYFPGIS